jgi:transcriptional regulator with XRE-family HTH domain
MEHPLRTYRTGRDLSLEALAADFGLTKSQLSRIERGCPTSPETALKIWQRTGVKVGPLVNASDRDIRAVERVLAKAA